MSGTATSPLTDTQADQILAAIRAGLRVVLTSPVRVEPGDLVNASLVPASPEIDASELVNGILNLAWIAKDVLFPDPDPVNVPSAGDLEGDQLASTIAGIQGQALPLPIPVPGPGSVTSSTPPGVLGQLFGTVAVPRLKVRLHVRWIVRNQGGNTLNDGQDFIAQQGLGSPSVSLVFPPVFGELRLDTLEAPNPAGDVRCLSAEVTLALETTAGPKTLTFEVGPVPVLVLPLLFPTVVVVFSEPTFEVTAGSAAFIVAPEHSPFASAEPLFKTLRKIERVVSAVRGIARFARFFLGLDELIGSVPQQPRLRFAAADGVKNFKKIILKKKPWYNFLGRNKTFNNKAYSILVFGLPGTKVQFFNDKEFRTRTTSPSSKKGTYLIEVGNECFVAVRSLETDKKDPPVTFPPGRVVFFEPASRRWYKAMSSLQFHKDWLDVVNEEIRNPPTLPSLTCTSPQSAPVGAPPLRQ